MIAATLPKRRETLSFGKTPHGVACLCEHCKRNKKFQMPSELADILLDGKVVLIVGAGISTEAKGLLHDNFYEKISHVVGSKDSNRPFPDVMEDFCAGPSRRVALIEMIKDHFNYIFAHRTIYDDATRFHHELATFFPIDTIVTTNWDTYFEDECAATPFVEDKDIALWNGANRKILKLHGTVANFGSIVATRSDYDRCSKRLRSGLLGAHLKSLLATRPAVFIGYSLRDDDFLQVYNAVKKKLGDFGRQAYFIAPEISDAERLRLTELGLQLIESLSRKFLSLRNLL